MTGRPPVGWDDPLERVAGRSAAGLHKAFALLTVGHLLEHYPRRYEQRGRLTELRSLERDDNVTVLAEVRAVRTVHMRANKGSMLKVVVTDGTSDLNLTFFHPKQQRREIRVGVRGLFAGKVTMFNGERQLAQPVYELLPDVDAAVALTGFADAMIPIYPATGTVPSWKIGALVLEALERVQLGDDPLPADLRRRHDLPGQLPALQMIHRPADRAQAMAAAVRFKWDEALRLQVALAQRRAGAMRTPATPRPRSRGGLLEAFDAALPFTLTSGQQRVGDALFADLAAAHPMHRLLSGEVGSGKTVVALRAMLAVIDAGGQAALLAPTEVLAAQHLRSLRALLGPLGAAGELGAASEATAVTLLTGSLSAAARREALAAVADGRAGIVVGTHALLSETVQFADLGLVVVDEQHRFGVRQRDALRGRARAENAAHLLVMTATPIPRTVAMTVFGDLETSMLTELPAGRRPITSHVVPDSKPVWIERMWAAVRAQVAAGRQAYVVCPRIDGSEKDLEEQKLDRRPSAAVLETLPSLETYELAGLRLGALHGRQSSEDKDATMRAFAAGDLDVLVATTVIEVGVDVANATAMVVLDADRFGISQLHQLRGRIGRGGHDSTCFLHTQSGVDSPSGRRLAAVAATTDGARLAVLDLETRHEGDVLGDEQSGTHSRLKLLKPLADEELVSSARAYAQELIGRDPELAGEPALAAAVATMITDPEYLERG